MSPNKISEHNHWSIKGHRNLLHDSIYSLTLSILHSLGNLSRMFYFCDNSSCFPATYDRLYHLTVSYLKVFVANIIYWKSGRSIYLCKFGIETGKPVCQYPVTIDIVIPFLGCN